MFATPTPLKTAQALRARRTVLRLDVRPIAFGNALANSLVESLPATAAAQPSPDGRWQQQLDDRLNEQLQDQRDFEDSLNDQAHAGYLAERQRDIADRLNDAAHAGYLASRQRDIADRLNDRTHAGYLAGVRAKATEQRAAQAARLGQAADRNSHRAAELSQQAQATRAENQIRITSNRLPDYGVMHPRLKGATLPVGQVSERFNAFRKELEARSAVDPNNLVHLYERIVSEQKNIGSRTDLLAPTESLRLTSMEAYVRGYANLKGIQLPSEAEFYGGMQALGTPVGDAGAPPYGARRITTASLRNNGGVTNGGNSERLLGARGGRVEFGVDPAASGGPLRELSNANIKITDRGIDVVERHISRFGSDAANDLMVGRLRGIASGKVEATVPDYNFYAHELREFTRVRRLGFETGTLPNEVYYNAHSAALREYGIFPIKGQELRPLYHPDAIRLIEGGK
ncbi:MAG: hypothetical protein ING36_09900 [Burkholderiales bacterium]|jgi:hypothetical protein|nr:hypothetical protein [Burkholderiales bacterium]